MLQTVYINHIISLNPLKCLVEWDDFSHINEYTENCTATSILRKWQNPLCLTSEPICSFNYITQLFMMPSRDGTKFYFIFNWCIYKIVFKHFTFFCFQSLINYWLYYGSKDLQVEIWHLKKTLQLIFLNLNHFLTIAC